MVKDDPGAETYGDYLIWYAPSPDGNPNTAWRWERKGCSDGDLEAGCGATRDECAQTIDMIGDMDREMTIEEADSAHRALVKFRELDLFNRSPLVIRNLVQAARLPNGFAHGILLSMAEQWLADFDNRHAKLDEETVQ